MTVRADNAKTQEAMRRRAAERAKYPPDSIVLPPDKDPLARWRGDHAALLARLQESYGELWLAAEVRGLETVMTMPVLSYQFIGQLIRAIREHMEEMP